MSLYTLLTGDVRDTLTNLTSDSVQCCITSPPYFALRDYQHAQQIGREADPTDYINSLVKVFRDVQRVLRPDGTLWVNIGDSYGKDKNLMGIPWTLAFALRDDGWILRQDIIWHKPKVMPESVKDRCTKAHEYVFLFTQSPNYYYNADAIREPLSAYYQKTLAKLGARPPRPTGVDNFNKQRRAETGIRATTSREARAGFVNPKGRNKRSVWTISPASFKGAHFATFPKELVRPMILAGSRPGDLVLDPFSGAATTGVVALEEGRRYVGCELNPEYQHIAEERLRTSMGVYQ